MRPHETIIQKIYEKTKSMEPKKLAIIQVGDNKSSNLYISIKKKRLAEVGFFHEHIRFPEEISYEQFVDQIKLTANDDSIDAMIVQLPIPKHLLPALEEIPAYKDADGLTLRNQGLLFRAAPKDSYIAPATALGCIAFLEAHSVRLEGSQVAIFGKSMLVGKPIACLLQERGATVVVLSRKDQKQKSLSSKCDILIAAMGAPHYVTPDYVKENAFVVDIGVTKVEENVLGDVHSDVREKARFVSSTKGDIGPLTVAFLISNIMECSRLRNERL